MRLRNIFSILDIPHNVFRHLDFIFFLKPSATVRKTNITESAAFVFEIAAFKSAANHRAQTVKVALVR